MPITEGPWAYDRDTLHIVSTVEFEDYSIDDDDEDKIPKRIICTYGAMGENSEFNLPLMIAAPEMLKALKEWKCPACGGAGQYLHRGWTVIAHKGPKFQNKTVPCKKCQGNGYHPIAWAAIQLATGPARLINE